MSTLENPSEQLRFALDALNDFAAGRLDALGPKLSEVSNLFAHLYKPDKRD